MRITGGKAKGITVKAPKGDQTRPATDRMREAVFSSLGARVESAIVADLFAGTGGYGLEAMSRGASSCTFIEMHAKTAQVLRENTSSFCRHTQTPSRDLQVIQKDVFAYPTQSAKFDLIFVDPPYDQLEAIIDRLFDEVIDTIGTPDALVVFEIPGHFEIGVNGWREQKRLGKRKRDRPTVSILARSDA